MKRKPCRVLIADDHPVVREGIKQIFGSAPGMTVGGEARTGEETIAKVRAGKWDAVLLDLSMPGPNGLELLQKIKRLAPALPVLILTIHPEEQLAVRFIKAGAAGYIAKENAPEELVKAVTKVVGGGKYISPTLADRLATGLGQADGDVPHESLSHREYDVLSKIGAGMTVTEIAEALEISVKTVSTYRRRILDKMRLKTSAELIRYAIQNGLVSEPLSHAR